MTSYPFEAPTGTESGDFERDMIDRLAEIMVDDPCEECERPDLFGGRAEVVESVWHSDEVGITALVSCPSCGARHRRSYREGRPS